MYSAPDNLLPDCTSEALPPPRGATPYPNGNVARHEGDAEMDRGQSVVNVRATGVGAVPEHANMSAEPVTTAVTYACRVFLGASPTRDLSIRIVCPYDGLRPAKRLLN